MTEHPLIIVFYLGAKNMRSETVDEYSSNLTKIFAENEKTKNMLQYVVPVNEDESWIECINPVHITEEEYKNKIQTILTETETKFNEFLKQYRNDTNKGDGNITESKSD